MNKILGSTIVILLLTFVGLIFSINSIVKTGIEKVAPNILNADVSLDSVSISIFSGKGTLENLVVGSPRGFKSDHAFRLKKVSVNIDMGSIFSDKIIIREMIIDAPEIVYEINEKGLNINRLLNSARIAKNQQALQDSSGDITPMGSSKKVVIEDLIIKNGQVTLATNLLGQGLNTSSPLPDINMTDIGKESDEGISFASATLKILRVISKKVASTRTGSVQLKGAAKGLKDTLDAMDRKLKGLLD